MTDAIRIPERSGDALLLGGSPVQPQADLNWAEQFFTQLGYADGVSHGRGGQ
jgi:hypothetical protein